MPIKDEFDKNDVESWRAAVVKGLAFRDKVADAALWSNYRDYYRGNFSTKLFYNIIFGLSTALRPNIYFRLPYINVAPNFRPDLMWHAKLVESVDNYLLPQMGVKKLAKRTVLDTYFNGTGIAKIGYDSQFGYDQAKTNDEGDATRTGVSKKGDRVEYNTNVQSGMPWILRAQTDSIVIPSGTTDFCESEWIAHIVFRPLLDVRTDTKYKNVKDLKASHIELTKDKPLSALYRSLGPEQAREWVEIVEIRDFKRGEIKCFAAGVDKMWIREPEEDVLQITGLPFEPLIWNEDPEWAWGVSDVKQFMPQQDEINETRAMLRVHRKLAVLKFLAEKGAFDPEEIAKLEQNNFAGFIFGRDIGTAIKELQHTMPADLAQWVNILRDDAREISGFSRMRLGEFQSGGSHRTATEANLVDSGGGIRLDEKRDAMADFLVASMKKVNQLIFSIWSSSTVTQMVGQDGAVYWVQYTPNAIKGDYTLKIDVESMMPTTKMGRKKEVMEVMQILSRVPNANMDLLTKILLSQYDWADALQLLPQAPGSPVPFDQFQSQQNQLTSNPQALLAARKENLQVAQYGMK